MKELPPPLFHRLAPGLEDRIVGGLEGKAAEDHQAEGVPGGVHPFPEGVGGEKHRGFIGEECLQEPGPVIVPLF
ncbi:hypothetical protein FACS189483_10000 [Spirochaetia bacterium]|nr:hypothetical protein FACS189483_10000 [Spirochaetia bacterium]